MTGVVITQQLIGVVITPEDHLAVVLYVPAPAVIEVKPVGTQGPSGIDNVTAGAGLVRVGDEIRMAIGTLPTAG